MNHVSSAQTRQRHELGNPRIPLCSRSVMMRVRSVSSVFRSKLGDLAHCQRMLGTLDGRSSGQASSIPGKQLLQQRQKVVVENKALW